MRKKSSLGMVTVHSSRSLCVRPRVLGCWSHGYGWCNGRFCPGYWQSFLPPKSTRSRLVFNAYGTIKHVQEERGLFFQTMCCKGGADCTTNHIFPDIGIATMELTYMAKKIFLVSIANEAAELNWKQYKDNSTKNRSALLPDKVHKLICIQASTNHSLIAS